MKDQGTNLNLHTKIKNLRQVAEMAKDVEIYDMRKEILITRAR